MLFRSERGDEEATWEDVINESKIPWTRDLIEGLQKRGFGDGNPRCRFFGAKRNTRIGNLTTLCFRSDNFLIHVYGQTPENEEMLKSKIGLPLEPWGRSGDRRSGWGFRLRTDADMKTFFSALDGDI